MSEQHNIEWKATRKDEYLRWICGFANAQAVCQTQGYPEPRFELFGEDMTVTFFAAGQGESVQTSGESVQAPGNKHERIRQVMLASCVEPHSLGEIFAKLVLRHLSYLRKVYIKPLLGSRLEMTHPENPRLMHQRYRTIVSDDKQNG